MKHFAGFNMDVAQKTQTSKLKPSIDNINLKDIKLRVSDISPLDSHKGRHLQPGTGKKGQRKVSDYDCAGVDSPNKYNSFGDSYGDGASPGKLGQSDNDSDEGIEKLVQEHEKLQIKLKGLEIEINDQK